MDTKSPPYVNKTLGPESRWRATTGTSIPPPGNATQQNLTAEAYACQASWIAYSAALATLLYSTPYERTTWSVPIGYGDVYTTIDGIPVAHGTLTSTGSTWMTTRLPRPESSYAVNGEQPSSPDCFISMEICTQMHETYMQSLGLTLYIDKDPKINPIPTNSPRCILAPFPLDQDGGGTSILGPSCSFWGGNVELFYWPPQTDLTSVSITTAPMVPKEAVTVVRNSTLTMTSPSIYVSFDVLTAWSEAAKWVFDNYSAASDIPLQSQIGNTYSNYILPMDPEDVSTIRWVVTDWSEYIYSVTAFGKYNYDLYSYSWDDKTARHSSMVASAYPLDLARLTAPLPQEYYLNPNWDCGPNGSPACRTIFDGAYKPQLSLPSHLLRLDSAWSSCEPYLYGVYDPPKALTAATALMDPAYPTKALPSLTTPAAAASKLKSPTAYATETITTASPFKTKSGAASTRIVAAPSGVFQSYPIVQKSSSGDERESQSTSNQVESEQAEASAETSKEKVVGEGTSLLPKLYASHTSDAPLPAVVSSAQPGSWNENPTAANISAGLPTHESDPTSLSAETDTDSETAQSSEIVLGTSQPGNALSVLSAAYESYLSTETSTALPVIVSSSLPMETSTTQSTVLNLGSTSLTLLDPTPGGTIIVGTSTVHPGAQVTFDQQTISYGSSGLEVVHAGSTSTYNFDPMPTSSKDLEEDQDGRETFTIGSMTVYKSKATGPAVVAGTTLSVGGSELSVNGQELSLAPSGLAVASGSETKLLPFTTAADRPTSSVGPQVATLTIASSTITATRLAPSAIVIDESQTLQVGGPAYTADDETFLTLTPEGLILANGDQTSTVLAISRTTHSPPQQTVITAGGLTWTAAPLSNNDGSQGVSIGDTTLYPDGPALTLCGKILTAASDGRLVVQDSSMTTTVRVPALVSQESAATTTTSNFGAESDAEASQSSSEVSSESEPITTAASSTGSVRGAGLSISADLSLGLYILVLLLLLVYIL
ncbi:hypothetical protein KC351_g13550 [Hortaea werneckii]|nr:hypothetical protein KC351_g13550 [Hortaea werneckii]